MARWRWRGIWPIRSVAPTRSSMATDAPPPSMFPLMLDVTAVPVLLAGGKAGLAPRLEALREHGAANITVFAATGSDFPGAGATVHGRWPTAEDFAALRPRLVFISDVDDAQASVWRAMAHGVGALVHVQDRVPLCDFHMPAVLRR